MANKPTSPNEQRDVTSFISSRPVNQWVVYEGLKQSKERLTSTPHRLDHLLTGQSESALKITKYT